MLHLCSSKENQTRNGMGSAYTYIFCDEIDSYYCGISVQGTDDKLLPAEGLGPEGFKDQGPQHAPLQTGGTSVQHRALRITCLKPSDSQGLGKS
jgi:hypothetical protein